jgi:hypothetical protein
MTSRRTKNPCIARRTIIKIALGFFSGSAVFGIDHETLRRFRRFVGFHPFPCGYGGGCGMFRLKWHCLEVQYGFADFQTHPFAMTLCK